MAPRDQITLMDVSPKQLVSVAAALVPALAFDGWLTIQAARSERTQIERNADDKTKEVMADIDHEIASAKAVTYVWLVDAHFTPVSSPPSMFDGMTAA